MLAWRRWPCHSISKWMNRSGSSRTSMADMSYTMESMLCIKLLRTYQIGLISTHKTLWLKRTSLIFRTGVLTLFGSESCGKQLSQRLACIIKLIWNRLTIWLPSWEKRASTHFWMPIKMWWPEQFAVRACPTSTPTKSWQTALTALASTVTTSWLHYWMLLASANQWTITKCKKTRMETHWSLTAKDTNSSITT